MPKEIFFVGQVPAGPDSQVLQAPDLQNLLSKPEVHQMVIRASAKNRLLPDNQTQSAISQCTICNCMNVTQVGTRDFPKKYALFAKQTHLGSSKMEISL
jgi:hypothetical protein